MSWFFYNAIESICSMDGNRESRTGRSGTPSISHPLEQYFTKMEHNALIP